MCPVLSSFSRSVNCLNKQAAESLQRFEHIGYQFDELDPQHTPVKNIYSECLQNDYIFQNVKRNKGTDGQSLSNMMSARQAARSKTPTGRADHTPDKKESSFIMNIFSKINSKTPNHKHVPLDDVSSFLESSNQGGEFSQIGKEKNRDAHTSKNRQDESYYSKENWEASYRNDPKQAKYQTEKTRVDETRFDPFDKSKGPSKVEKSQNYSKSKTPTKPGNKSIWDSNANQTYMNETAAMSYTKSSTKKQVSTISTKEIGLEEDIDIATQIKLLEEAEKKHKEAQRKKEKERRRTEEYFAPQAAALPEQRQSNPYADHSRSHINSTMMTAMNDKSLHRGPPAPEQPSMAKSSTTNNPFGEFLDCIYHLI